MCLEKTLTRAESLRCKKTEINVSANGVCKLLSNSNVAKAVGPDAVLDILKELSNTNEPAEANMVYGSFRTDKRHKQI